MSAGSLVPSWWWVFLLILAGEVVFVHCIETYLHLTTGTHTLWMLVGLAFVFAPGTPPASLCRLAGVAAAVYDRRLCHGGAGCRMHGGARAPRPFQPPHGRLK